MISSNDWYGREVAGRDGPAHDAARFYCGCRASTARSVAPQARLNRRDLADIKIWNTAEKRGWLVMTSQRGWAVIGVEERRLS